jgi:hypothetical protein
MALGSSPEEIFRFSVVRNPQPVASDKLRHSVVRIVPDDPGRDYRYLNALLEVRRQNPTRRAIITNAQRLMANPEFKDQLDNLKTPLRRYVERLNALRRPSLSEARDLVSEVFGQSPGSLTTDAGFESDKVVISDSLVLASVVTPVIPGLRTQLMQARRAIAFIDRLAELRGDEADAAGAEKLLDATLLLPPTLFPIPDNNKERRDKNNEAHARQKTAFDEQTARAQRLLDELSKNTAAADELSASLSKHLFETMHRPTESDPQPEALSVLPPARVKALSAASKKVVLNKLAIPEKAVDVPFVVDQLEKANLKLGYDLTSKFGDLLVNAGPFYLPGCGECKPVVLPPPKAENEFDPDTRGEVELVGIQDLLIVRQKLLDYRAGEIAHVENVLQGEQKGKTHRKLDRTEVTTVEEIEKETEIEEELQTTDKYELQTETSRVIQEDKSMEAGVTVTASYGSVNIEAHGNYASNTSTAESRNSAATFARDVVSRSLQRIRERVLTRLTRTQLTEIEITNRHQFDNTRGDDHVTGVYRWLDKLYEAQIVNYGKRTMLEFMIPEPAAFYKYAAEKRPKAGPAIPKPEQPGFCRNGVFHPLTPGDLQPENYLCFVGKYNVKNVTAPSPRFRQLADVLKYKFDSVQGDPVAFAEINDSFKIPDGYVPKGLRYTIVGGNSHSATTKHNDHDDIILVVVAIGDRKVLRYYKNEIGEASGSDSWPDLTQVIEWGNPLSSVEQAFGSYFVGDLKGEFPLQASNVGTGDPDVVKVSITGHTTLPMSVTVHYTVLCERSPTKFQQWQIDTFNAIADAYENLKAEYDDEQQRQQTFVEPEIQGRNPLLSRELEKRELKKFSISLLTGQQYESFNAMEEDYQTGIPQIDLADAAEEGRFVRFFEQALEWRNMTYLFYPYFWSNKNKWAEILMGQDADPLFQQFLQAGFARVWVPVRPGFEPVILNYIECGGEPWTEKDAPIIGDPDETLAPSVALIDEIKEQLGADFEFRPGTISVHKNSPMVEGNGTDFREDDQDREILIALNYYRIAEVDVAAQKIRLREPYAGENKSDIGVAIGPKFVGEPWVVQVPTTLVLLTNADLITQ